LNNEKVCRNCGQPLIALLPRDGLRRGLETRYRCKNEKCSEQGLQNTAAHDPEGIFTASLDALDAFSRSWDYITKMVKNTAVDPSDDNRKRTKYCAGKSGNRGCGNYSVKIDAYGRGTCKSCGRNYNPGDLR